jgi:hypothetical protein
LFTKQAAHRDIKNLVVSLASADVKKDIKLKDRVLGTCIPATASHIVGHYTPHFFSDDTRPTLFLVHIKAIRSPTLGIANNPFGATKLPRRERHHLFLIPRRAAWPRAWDPMIDSYCSPIDTDDTVLETECKKLVTMADGTKVSTVKTADDFAGMLAAEVTAKERK